MKKKSIATKDRVISMTTVSEGNEQLIWVADCTGTIVVWNNLVLFLSFQYYFPFFKIFSSPPLQGSTIRQKFKINEPIFSVCQFKNLVWVGLPRKLNLLNISVGFFCFFFQFQNLLNSEKNKQIQLKVKVSRIVLIQFVPG